MKSSHYDFVHCRDVRLACCLFALYAAAKQSLDIDFIMSTHSLLALGISLDLTPWSQIPLNFQTINGTYKRKHIIPIYCLTISSCKSYANPT